MEQYVRLKNRERISSRKGDSMILEIGATTLLDAILAEENGADRIELSSGMVDGGYTPSYGLMEKVMEQVKIPVHIVVRPHNQTFVYNKDDLDTMRRDIQLAKELGAKGIIIGCLTEEKEIDVHVLSQLLSEADGLDVTFSHAFDQVRDQEEALEALQHFPQIKRVTTSGSDKTALAGIPQIKKLLRRLQGQSLTLVGSKGLKPENMKPFLEVTKLTEVRLGAGVRVNCQYTQPINPKSVQAARQLCDKLK